MLFRGQHPLESQANVVLLLFLVVITHLTNVILPAVVLEYSLLLFVGLLFVPIYCILSLKLVLLMNTLKIFKKINPSDKNVVSI